MENAWLAGDGEAGPLDDLIGHSITYRIAVGPRAGQKLFTLQTVPNRPPEWLDDPNGAARAGRLSLHAGIELAPQQRAPLVRLCRSVSRAPVAEERLALTTSGQVHYTLETRTAGTTQTVLEPLDLMARLAARVPPPRMHLTRYHGVFAPHSRLRAAVTPAGRGMGASRQPITAAEPGRRPTPRHVTMDWARRLQRVFGIEIDIWQRCGGQLRTIATIEQPWVWRRSSRTSSARSRPGARSRQPDRAGRRPGMRIAAAGTGSLNCLAARWCVASISRVCARLSSVDSTSPPRLASSRGRDVSAASTLRASGAARATEKRRSTCPDGNSAGERCGVRGLGARRRVRWAVTLAAC